MLLIKVLIIRQARDPFILVLIDGDGMIFEDHLLKKGEAGGKESAAILWSATRDYVNEVMPDLSSNYKIVVRIYANLKGLGEVCHRATILENPATAENFARGFTGSKQLFDFVDVGIGKDRADDKISGEIGLQHVQFGKQSNRWQKFSNFIFMIATAGTFCSAVLTTMVTHDSLRTLQISRL